MALPPERWPCIYQPMTPVEIRTLRERLKMTQHEFAEMLHVSVYTLRAWEWGKLKMRRVYEELLWRKADKLLSQRD